MNIKVDLGDFERAMARLAGQVDEQTASEIAAVAAEPLLDEARQIIRAEFYDTGETYHSTDARPIPGGVRVGPTTPHAVWGELGTVHRPPVAFMRRSADATRRQVLERMEREVARRVSSV